MGKQKILALLAAFGATLIYGLNHTIAKVIMPDFIGAYGFIMLRLLGAGLLFWMISPLAPKEKFKLKTIFVCSLAVYWVCASIC